MEPNGTPVKLFPESEYLLSSCTLRNVRGPLEAEKIAAMLSQMDPWKTLKYSTKSLYEYLLRHDPSLTRYAIIHNSQVVGAVSIRYPWLLGPCIELIGILHGYHGRGLGKQILLWIEARTRLKSKNVWVVVSGFNEPAYKFYLHAGYSETARIQDLILSGYDEILLRKVLS